MIQCEVDDRKIKITFASFRQLGWRGLLFCGFLFHSMVCRWHQLVIFTSSPGTKIHLLPLLTRKVLDRKRCIVCSVWTFCCMWGRTDFRLCWAHCLPLKGCLFYRALLCLLSRLRTLIRIYSSSPFLCLWDLRLELWNLDRIDEYLWCCDGRWCYRTFHKLQEQGSFWRFWGKVSRRVIF